MCPAHKVPALLEQLNYFPPIQTFQWNLWPMQPHMQPVISLLPSNILHPLHPTVCSSPSITKPFASLPPFSIMPPLPYLRPFWSSKPWNSPHQYTGHNQGWVLMHHHLTTNQNQGWTWRSLSQWPYPPPPSAKQLHFNNLNNSKLLHHYFKIMK